MLIFDPSIHASRAVGSTRQVSRPYLDRISPTPHLPNPDSAPWRKTFISAVTLPDLDHTGLRSEVIRHEASLLRPDGAVSKDMRPTLAAKFEQISSGNSDIILRDRRQRSRRTMPTSSQPWLLDNCSTYATKEAREEHAQDNFEILLVQNKNGEPPTRPRRPYSTTRLATLLLEAEFGPC